MRAADAWLTRFLAGEARALARGLSWLEAADPRGAALLAAARVATRERATAVRVIGLTGAPGAGKSTLADRLIEAWRARGVRVAVLAVDPSSPFSGGALLGDRVRMTRWAGDDGVFVRSMASRGSTGGLAPASLDALSLLAAFGFDVVLLETVGVGQAEVDVAAVADTTVVALAPGQGDDVQAAKAGLMEIADVFALTKADRPEAERLAREVRSALSERSALFERDSLEERDTLSSPVAAWRPALVMVAAGAARADLPPTVAADGGVAALLDAVEAHAEHLRRSGEGRERRAARIRLSVGLRAHTVAQAALGELPAERWAAVAAGQAPVDALVVDALEAALRALRGAEGVPGGAPGPADPSPADC
jgi:LAO/AO transport system kinase